MIGLIVKSIDETMENSKCHTPVMPQEVKEYLKLFPGACFVDCTMGVGGHSMLLAPSLGTQGRIIGIDRDRSSLKVAQENLKEWREQCILLHEDFRHIDKILDQLGITEVDGILFDLGVSSFQLDDPLRGFSLKYDGPLDMRMDQDAHICAYDLINSLSEREIALILKNYGEERLHNRIARTLVQARSTRPLESTKELRDIVIKSLPLRYQRQKVHPATRTFQAFRIAVNRELESMDLALEKCVDYLKPGARICVISFHSLEDRIVKQKFRSFVQARTLRLILKKPLCPTQNEIDGNPRSRSAKLRVAERL